MPVIGINHITTKAWALLKLRAYLLVAAVSMPLLGCSVADVPGNLSYVAATEALSRRDYPTAFETLSNLEARGGFHDITSVRVLLARLYLEGRGTPQDIPKGVALLKQAANSKDDLNWVVIAQSKLATIYEDGKSPTITPDLVAAANWYRKASQLGSDGATRALRRLSRNPAVYVRLHRNDFSQLPPPAPGGLENVPLIADPKRLFEIVRWHAHAGNRDAQFRLARLIYSGKGTDKNEEHSVRWLYLSAENGYPLAQYVLSSEYRRGNIIDIDFDAHEKWLMAAAAQNHPDALNDLGALRVSPLKKGQSPNLEMAFKLYEKAADLGSITATVNLGGMYAEGLGVPKNIEKAKALYRKAAAAGNQTAKRRLRGDEGIGTASGPERVVIKERIIVERTPEAGPSAETIFKLRSNSVFQVMVASVETQNGKFKLTGAGRGSAVAVSASHALTNCHVVKDMNVVLVRVGGASVKAEVVHREIKQDICVIRLAKQTLKPIENSRSFDGLNIGETVYAIGSPAGLENSISQGIISGKRRVKGQWWIQTTAAISPGSSGGGLFDKKGNLIGITTFKSSGVSDEGLNFAAPVHRFLTLAREDRRF
jgi:TPR repeat protein